MKQEDNGASWQLGNQVANTHLVLPGKNSTLATWKPSWQRASACSTEFAA